MQKQESTPLYETEYAPMSWYFRENRTNLYVDFYSVPQGRITHLHYHDAVELVNRGTVPMSLSQE